MILDVHHRTYERLGKERLSDVAAVCRFCHDLIHAAERTSGLQLSYVTSLFAKPQKRHAKKKRVVPRKRRQSLVSEARRRLENDPLALQNRVR